MSKFQEKKDAGIKTVSVEMPMGMFNDLVELGQQSERSVSWLIRHAVKALLAKEAAK